MRNGNHSRNIRKAHGALVQSNLWGMETRLRWCNPRRRFRFNRIYEEWKPNVKIPERQYFDLFNRIYEEWKLELSNLLSLIQLIVQSNLWGMETTFASYCITLPWRVQSNLWGMETFVVQFPVHVKDVFNRIYEEWKHAAGQSVDNRRSPFNRIYEEWKLITIIEIEDFPMSVQSNLWGMETKAQIARPPARQRVQSNLWGMETWSS